MRYTPSFIFAPRLTRIRALLDQHTCLGAFSCWLESAWRSHGGPVRGLDSACYRSSCSWSRPAASDAAREGDRAFRNLFSESSAENIAECAPARGTIELMLEGNRAAEGRQGHIGRQDDRQS